MKKDIHPKYAESTVKCVCGNEFVTGSVLEEVKTELCSKCHPFYTGKQRLVDTARRVEKFETKLGQKTDKPVLSKAAKLAAKAAAKAEKAGKK